MHYVCIDWRHLGELLEAGRQVYGETVNLAVWVKSNAGQGSFYRSQLVGVFRVGEVSHLNNVELGRHGRSRSNVWHYAGVNTFRAGRMEELSGHPTVKPTPLVADAIKDCTRRGDVVLDSFCGSGTTILALSVSGDAPVGSRSNLALSTSRCGGGRRSPGGMRSMTRAAVPSTSLPLRIEAAAPAVGRQPRRNDRGVRHDQHPFKARVGA